MDLRITILPDAASFDKAAADRLYGQIAANPRSVIGLSTGRTTENMHRILAERLSSHPLDLTGITFFGQDEVTGVPQEYSGACFTMLMNDLIGPAGIEPSNFLMFPTSQDKYPRAVSDFVAELTKRGGIDLFVLGLGENGHLGFNQPGTSFGSTARVAEVSPDLEARIRHELNLDPGHPIGGATLGLRDIMHARHLILAAKGLHKAAIVKQMLQGPVTESVPASILQMHPDCEFLLDAEAASLL